MRTPWAAMRLAPARFPCPCRRLSSGLARYAVQERGRLTPVHMLSTCQPGPLLYIQLVLSDLREDAMDVRT